MTATALKLAWNNEQIGFSPIRRIQIKKPTRSLSSRDAKVSTSFYGLKDKEIDNISDVSLSPQIKKLLDEMTIQIEDYKRIVDDKDYLPLNIQSANFASEFLNLLSRENQPLPSYTSVDPQGEILITWDTEKKKLSISIDEKGEVSVGGVNEDDKLIYTTYKYRNSEIPSGLSSLINEFSK